MAFSQPVFYTRFTPLSRGPPFTKCSLESPCLERVIRFLLGSPSQRTVSGGAVVTTGAIVKITTSGSSPYQKIRALRKSHPRTV